MLSGRFETVCSKSKELLSLLSIVDATTLANIDNEEDKTKDNEKEGWVISSQSINKNTIDPNSKATLKQGEIKRQELISATREYGLAGSINVARGLEAEGSVRRGELAGLMTVCALENPHRIRGLSQAIAVMRKLHATDSAAHFAFKLISLDPGPDMTKRANNAIDEWKSSMGSANAKGAAAGKKPVTPSGQLKWNEATEGVCCLSLTGIITREEIASCSWCGALAKKEHTGKACPICELGDLESV